MKNDSGPNVLGLVIVIVVIGLIVGAMVGSLCVVGNFLSKINFGVL